MSIYEATPFGSRVIRLSTGQDGLRGGLSCEVRVPSDVPDLPVLDFVASDETIDRYREVIKLDGWDLSAYDRNPVVVDSHDYSSVARIIGKSIETQLLKEGLVNSVEFCMDNPLGSLAYKMAKAGFIRAESVGFIPREYKLGNDPKEPSVTYTKTELIEISLVAVPANPNAVMALKSGAITRGDLRDVIDELKRICESEPESTSQGRAAARETNAAHESLARSIDALHKAVRG